MVIFLKEPYCIEKAILLSNESKDKPLWEIIAFQDNYWQIGLKAKVKNIRESSSYRILSELEDSQYIIELKQGLQIKFWLHRYDLTFRLTA